MKTSLARRIYRIVPKGLRKTRLVNKISIFFQGILPHNWVYDETYYTEAVEGAAKDSAKLIAETVVRHAQPKRVVDVGCGTGAMLEIFRDSGCEVLGLEKSEAALKFCRSRNLPVTEFDLEGDQQSVESKFDVVLSMEVAEHLPQSVDDKYIDLLTALAPLVVFTAATPGQGGTDHVNEQPHEYWEAKFNKRGYKLDRALTDKWRQEWKASGKVTRWYYNNLLVFQKNNIP